MRRMGIAKYFGDEASKSFTPDLSKNQQLSEWRTSEKRISASIDGYEILHHQEKYVVMTREGFQGGSREGKTFRKISGAGRVPWASLFGVVIGLISIGDFNAFILISLVHLGTSGRCTRFSFPVSFESDSLSRVESRRNVLIVLVLSFVIFLESKKVLVI